MGIDFEYSYVIDVSTQYSVSKPLLLEVHAINHNYDHVKLKLKFKTWEELRESLEAIHKKTGSIIKRINRRIHKGVKE